MSKCTFTYKGVTYQDEEDFKKVLASEPVLILYKGVKGKINVNGEKFFAHPNVNSDYIFTTTDPEIASRYNEYTKENLQQFEIPQGTTIETIEVDTKQVPLSMLRDVETELINSSEAQIVELVTTDSRGKETQYIIRDSNIQPTTEPTKAGKAHYAEPASTTVQSLITKDGTNSVKTILEQVVSENNNYSKLAKLLLKMADKDGLNVKLFKEGKKSISYYHATTDKITISESQISDLSLILHEIIHALTYHKLPSNFRQVLEAEAATGSVYLKALEIQLAKKDGDPIVKNIIQAYLTAVKKSGYKDILFGKNGLAGKAHEVGDTKIPYGLTDIDEFLSEVFSNPNFQEYLNGIPSTEPNKSVWKQLIDAIKKLLLDVTGTPSLEGSLLEQVIINGAELIHRDRILPDDRREIGKATYGKPEFTGDKAEENFNRWKGENKLVEGSEIQDIKTGEPVVVKVYHGTTNDFYEFDATKKGTVEAHLGKVNYFTSDYGDAAQNYQSTGADLTNRIAYRKDILEFDLRDKTKKEIADDFGLKLSQIKNKSNEEIAQLIAEKELLGGNDKVLELYVKLNNPLVLGNKSTWIETIPQEDYADYMVEATKEVAQENDITEKEAKEEYDYDIRQKAIELSGAENRIITALEDALTENANSSKSAIEYLGDEVAFENEIDLNALEKALRKNEDFNFIDGAEGELVSAQIIADFFKNLGYDGIILTDVSQRFKNMGIGANTSHVHVFNEFTNQIKLADGTNVTFGESKDIRYMILGEQGAANLDTAEELTTRLDNLQVAKEMEAAGKTPKEIKLSTFWEKGKDNLWRYEILDGKIKDITPKKSKKTSSFGDITGETTLEEIYDNEELYKAYPKLGKTKVYFINPTFQTKDLFGFIFDNELYINNYEHKDAELQNRRLSHEISHLIQFIEGFAEGISTSWYRAELERYIGGIKRGDIQSITQENEFGVLRDALKTLFKESQGMIKDILLSLSDNEIKELSNLMYHRTAGEVEARNVEERLNLTFEQRRERLLQETEKVAREDQIILQNLLNQANYEQPRIKKTIRNTTSVSPIHQKLEIQLGGYEKTIENYNTQRQVESNRERLIRESKGVIDWAIEKGYYISPEQILQKYRATDADGTESEIYLDPNNDNVIIKNFSSTAANGYQGILGRILLYNHLFPALAYKIIGISEKKDWKNNTFASLVLEQPIVKNADNSTVPEIKKYFETLGFQFDETTLSAKDSSGIQLIDLHEGNILRNPDGNLFPIDVVVEFNTEDSPSKVPFNEFIEQVEPLEIYHTKEEIEDKKFDTPHVGLKEWGSGTGVRGKVLTIEEIPNKMYHVTTALEAVKTKGKLKVMLQKGLGGGQQIKGISLTSSKDIAENIERSLKQAVKMANAETEEKALKVLNDIITEDEKVSGEDLSHERRVSADYFNNRRSLNESLNDTKDMVFKGYKADINATKNPKLLDVVILDITRLKGKSVDDVGIVEVNKNDIPENAGVIEGTDAFLKEIKILSEIPISEDTTTPEVDNTLPQNQDSFDTIIESMIDNGDIKRICKL